MGGWGLDWTSPSGRKYPCYAVTASRVVDILLDIQKANKWYVSDEHTWAFCNDVWRRRDPGRAIFDTNAPTMAMLPSAEELRPVVNAAATEQEWWNAKPQEWGHRGWDWLHLFGVSFEYDAWMAAINRLGFLLDPARTPTHGCINCFKEWNAILRDSPPTVVSNEHEAAAWSFRAHNTVNTKRGVTPMRWETAAKLHRWKVNLR